MTNKQARISTLRVIGTSVATVIVAVAFLLLTGYLEVRARAAESGLTLGWLDEPIAVTAIHRPWSQDLGIALMTVAAIGALLVMQPQFSGDIRGKVPILIAIVVLAIFVIYYNVTTSSPYFGSLTSMLAPGVPSNKVLPDDTVLYGWFKMGSLSVSALVLVLTLIVGALFNPFRDRERLRQNAH